MMKFNALTIRFSRSEGGSDKTSRGDAAISYSPVPYSLPVQGPGPELLPAHPALLEARRIALEKQESISKDRKVDTASNQGFSQGEEVHALENPISPGSTSVRPTPQPSIAKGLDILPRDITNRDLSAALGTYLDYLSLVGEEQEECKSTSYSEAMKSHVVCKISTCLDRCSTNG